MTSRRPETAATVPDDPGLLARLEILWRTGEPFGLRVAGKIVARVTEIYQRRLLFRSSRDTIRSVRDIVRQLSEGRDVAVVAYGRVVAIILSPEQYELLTGVNAEEEKEI